MKLISFAIYLGIGAMLHALFVGSQFDWSSAWTFGWLFGWPIMVIGASWAFLLGSAIVVTIIVCLYLWLQSFAEWHDKRKRRKAMR